ncbi:nuclear transport factor 2 family protein [Nostoc sp.]|uniref:nuclear transport factor 2 family protein n=1 Tax=Nostoc sp. TaxID=1180 RepID=UPI002FF4AB38
MLVNNKQFIKNWIENTLQGQGNPLDDLDQQVVFFIPGARDNPIFGKFVGIEEVKRFFQLLEAKLLQKKVTQRFLIKDCIAEEKQVVVLLEETFIPEKDPSNVSFNHTTWVFKLNDEQKIVNLYCYDDTLVTSKLLE